ncbi:MAG: MFS transporter [Lachnospiraceae bacterium]|nr:MFS transporter [Lachnospiraceae bacterium]
MSKRMTGCGLMIFLSGSIAFGFPGVMTSYWQDQFHVGNAETGLIITCMLFALAASMFFSGRVHAAKGLRICMLLGTALYLISYVVLLLATSIYMVYIWGFLANLGSSFLYGPSLTAGQQEYPEKKGVISGILNLCFGISGAVMAPVFQYVLVTKGAATLYYLIMLLFLVAGTGSVWLVGPERRDQMNGRKGSEMDLSVTQALKTKEFWLIWFTWVCMGAAGISMVSLSKTYALVMGASGVVLLTAFNLANGISRIFAGILTDWVGAGLTGGAAFALAGAGYLLLPHMHTIPTACLCAILVGIGFGTLFTITGPLASGLFGLKNFGMIFGLIFTAYGLVGGIAGPALSGLILERTGQNYGIVFSYLGILSVLAMILIIRIKKR